MPSIDNASETSNGLLFSWVLSIDTYYDGTYTFCDEYSQTPTFLFGACDVLREQALPDSIPPKQYFAALGAVDVELFKDPTIKCNNTSKMASTHASLEMFK